MVRLCIWLTRLTLACDVIRYRLVQVRQNLKKSARRSGLVDYALRLLRHPLFLACMTDSGWVHRRSPRRTGLRRNSGQNRRHGDSWPRRLAWRTWHVQREQHVHPRSVHGSWRAKELQDWTANVVPRLRTDGTVGHWSTAGRVHERPCTWRSVCWLKMIKLSCRKNYWFASIVQGHWAYAMITSLIVRCTWRKIDLMPNS